MKTAIHWLRWAAVLALVYSALGALVYSALVPGAYARRPAPLAAVQNLVFMFDYPLRQTAFVVAGALVAPRFRLATAIVFAALNLAFAFWGHVLATGGPWWSWTINYTHFTLETLGAMLGVAYVFWSEKTKRSVASAPPLQLSLWEAPPGSVGNNATITTAKALIRWLRWALVLALACSALAALVCAALHVPPPAPLAVVERLVFMQVFYTLRETAFIVAGATIAPRFRLTTAIILAAVHVPLSLWNHVLSRVSLAELVLFQGSGNYGHFALESFGAVLGVVYIYRTETEKGSLTSVRPAPSPP
ncbi:MAG TPA: hypothetical protein VG826_02300 [Pirellulales bacterium]|nr:hypothetical protein [Pirellulales bacterium]